MQKLNTTLVYILSVIGFLCCCAYGLGLVSAVIALVVANKELKKYAENPDQYSNGSAMKTARTVAIVAVVVSGIVSSYMAYEYFTTTEVERLEKSIEMYRSLGVPEEIIEALEDELEKVEAEQD